MYVSTHVLGFVNTTLAKVEQGLRLFPHPGRLVGYEFRSLLISTQVGVSPASWSVLLIIGRKLPGRFIDNAEGPVDKRRGKRGKRSTLWVPLYYTCRCHWRWSLSSLLGCTDLRGEALLAHPPAKNRLLSRRWVECRDLAPHRNRAGGGSAGGTSLALHPLTKSPCF